MPNDKQTTSESPSCDASCSDFLSALEWLRLKEWFLDYLYQDQRQKPAVTAFTASAARDAATAFESAVFEFSGRRIGDPNAKVMAAPPSTPQDNAQR
jgi:hypothetical protein